MDDASRDYEMEMGELGKRDVSFYPIRPVEALIRKAFRDEKLSGSARDRVIERALRILARATGCAPDVKRSDAMLEKMHEEKIITEAHLKVFYENRNTGRWD